MKMNRKLFIALATLLLFGMLAGCKKKENAQMQAAEQKQEVATTATTQTEAKPDTSTETETTTEDGFKMTGTVLIGYIGTNNNIVIPDGVTSIGGGYDNGAFQGCTILTSVIIPDSVTSIGSFAFSGCTSLISVTIGNGVIDIEWGAFEGCEKLASITVGPGNPNYASEGGIVYNKDKTEIVIVPQGLTGNVTIPNSVTIIWGFSGGGAFLNCINLTNVTIPNSVTKIGHGAFYGCTSLASVTIPNSVQEIWAEAFERCTSLTSVTFQGMIAANNLGSSSGVDYVLPPSPFYGDLQEKYLAGGIGTYTTTAPVKWDSKWTKQ
jgi:hypothetical protein